MLLNKSDLILLFVLIVLILCTPIYKYMFMKYFDN